MATTAIVTTTNVTVDAEGRIVLPPEALRVLRPEGEQVTLVDVEINAEDGRLVVRRSTIDEEDWWAYTPETRAEILEALRSPRDQDVQLSRRDLERLAGLESQMSDDSPDLPTLVFSRRFLQSLWSRDFGAMERSRILRALELLDRDERHPSLRVHALEGEFNGVWSASASDELRITFEHLENGRKRLLRCSRHYKR